MADKGCTTLHMNAGIYLVMLPALMSSQQSVKMRNNEVKENLINYFQVLKISNILKR